ncbi:probable carotenoid cleavage dioxygenase 4, chloroplastic [Tanacetum coccineum]
MMRTIGVAKLDIEASQDNKDPQEHTVASRIFGDNCFGGEPYFIARDPELVAVVKLPQRVPYGLHGTFLSKKDLSEMSW